MADGSLGLLFIGRVSLILVLILSGSFHIKFALTMTETTPGASEMLRNISYFLGLFQIVLAVGVFFVKSLLWASIVLIASLVILALLNLSGNFTSFNFLGAKNESQQILAKVFGYLVMVVWAYLFGIHFREKEGLVGWKAVKGLSKNE
jgi:hypothetical protein